MKRFIYVTFLILIGFIIPYQSFAQSGTLVIYASLEEATSLDAIIAADQAGGTPHLTYQLASTDTPYIFFNGIVIDNDVVIEGVPGTDGRLPCIMPAVLQDLSIPGHLFTFTKAGSVVRLENLYLLGISVLNSINLGDGFGVTVTGDNMKTYIDNVVFEQWSQFGINFSGQNDAFWVTNCHFRNFVNSGSVYTGEPFRMRNDLGVTLVDTVVMRNNTFLAVNAYTQCVPVGGYAKYVEFTHNTIAGCFKNPFFSMNVTNWKVEHNIFYATYVGGMSDGEYPWWDRVWAPGVGATIDLDPLNKANAGRFGIDTTLANWSDLAEAARVIDVNDNIYFRPQSITDFVDAINDTASSQIDSIIVTDWMNEITTNMFADDTKWPGLNAVGNHVGVDPIFHNDIENMIGAPGTTVPPENGVGLLPYLKLARDGGGVAGQFWGYAISAPDFTSGNWVPTWPLPERAINLLQYSAPLTATDGQRYGDPSWGGQAPQLITVDGQKDDFYNTLSGPGDGYLQIRYYAWNQNGQPTDDADLRTNVWTAWDNEWFYLYQEVMDDNITNGTTPNVYEVDNLELKFDPIPTPADTVTNTIWDTRLTAPGMTPGDSLNNITDGNNKQFSRHLVAGGYVAELAIRWSTIGTAEKITPAVDNIFGLAINQHDNEGAGRVASVMWASVMDDAVWNTPKYLGTVKFLADNKLEFTAQSSVTPWRVNEIPYDGSDYVRVGVGDDKSLLPKVFSLSQNYPNPFNPSTTIEFALPKQAAVELAIYNLLGEKVAVLISREMNAGYHRTIFDASSLPSGIYFYRINAGTFTQTKKLMLLK